VLREAPPAASAVIFTSGGPIGATGRQVLHLFAEDTLHLSWMSRNASFSDFGASAIASCSARSIAHPHLDEDSLLTYR
jgi:hypothetical protein